VNIYDVLLRIVEQRPFQEHEKRTAIKLIEQMEQLNVLGTTARHLDPATHECRQGEWWPDSGYCLICGVLMPVPAHIASRQKMWTGQNYVERCRICGEENHV
jgi:hypothetical protein